MHHTIFTQKTNILIINNEEHTIETITQTLYSLNYQIEISKSIITAQTFLTTTTPDLILLDSNLNNLGFCQTLKKQEHTKKTPIVFITETKELEKKSEFFQAGAVAYIVKPVCKQEIISIVSTYIRVYQLQRLLQVEIEFAEQLREKVEDHNKVLNEQVQKLTKEKAHLKTLTYHDDITQTANRHRLDEYVQQQWLVMARENQYLGVLFIAIDYFKEYLMNYGHKSADFCLYKVAQAIKIHLKRPADLIGRYQKEILMVILPNTNKEGTEYVGKSLKVTIDALQILNKGSSISHYITLSIGSFAIIPNAENNIEHFLKQVVQALKTAKEMGGNKLFSYK